MPTVTARLGSAAGIVVGVVRVGAARPAGVDGGLTSAALADMDRMRRAAADPAGAEAMARDAAKMLVMDGMADGLATDADCQQAAMVAMTDPGVMRVHERAAAMARDPAVVRQFRQEVMADPTAVATVMRQATRAAALRDRMTGSGVTDRATGAAPRPR